MTINADKSYIKNLLLLISFLFGFLCSCNSINQNSEAKHSISSQIENSSNNYPTSKIENQNQSIIFKGISLQNKIPSVSGIEASEVPPVFLEDENDKPDSVTSRSILLKLKGDYSKRFKDNFPKINIYPIAEFRQAFAVSKKLMGEFDKEIEFLQKIISRNIGKKDELPRIPFYDGSVEILTHFKKLAFKNGYGIAYITQYNVNYATIINNQELVYVFQGITTDKNYYILAILPISLKDLPETSQNNRFGNYELPQTYFDAKTDPKKFNDYKNYLASVEKLINKQNPTDFNPDLNKIEETLSSLEVNWKD